MKSVIIFEWIKDSLNVSSVNYIYGRAAVLAALNLQSNPDLSAEGSWDEAISINSQYESSRNKGCPRGAFLGLYYAGFIKNVAVKGKSSNSVNGDYAQAAYHLIKSNPSIAKYSSASVWTMALTQVGADTKKKHNGQMDVVLALCQNDLLK